MPAAILVVDDSKAIRQLLTLLLGKAGYAVCEARDGVEALEAVRGGAPRLVLCDLYMPRLDGLGFVRELRRLPEHAATPVIMLTTESQESGKEEGRALGVRAWIVKPFQPQQILDVVARFLGAPGG